MFFIDNKRKTALAFLVLAIIVGIFLITNASLKRKQVQQTDENSQAIASEAQNYIIPVKDELDILTTNEASDLFNEFKNKFINVANYFREFEKPSTYCFLTDDNIFYATENVFNDEIEKLLVNTDITYIESINNMYNSEKECYEYYTEFYIHKHESSGYSRSKKGYCQSIVYDPNNYKYEQLQDLFGNAYNFTIERKDLGDDWFLYLYYFNGIKNFEKLTQIAYDSLDEVSKNQLPDNWQEYSILTIEEVGDGTGISWFEQDYEYDKESIIKVKLLSGNSILGPITVYIDPISQISVGTKTSY